MTKQKDKAARPTRDELAEYFALEEERLALGRKVKDIGKLQGEIEEKVLAYVRQNGGPERTSIVCGYRLSTEFKNGRVEWKTEFMRVTSQEEAERISAAAPKKEVPRIEPPSP